MKNLNKKLNPNFPKNWVGIYFKSYKFIRKKVHLKVKLFLLRFGVVYIDLWNFFKNSDRASCIAMLYGYESKIADPVDDPDKEGQKL